MNSPGHTSAQEKSVSTSDNRAELQRRVLAITEELQHLQQLITSY